MIRVSSYRHLRGVHCASAALRNLVHHHTGEKWSEALCFGLGSGLNFTYIREPGAPFFLTMGRGSYIESYFSDAVGAQLESYHANDPREALGHVERLLEADALPMIDADMFYLPYMVQELGLMGGVHFGGHKVLVTGYDPDAASVEVSDYAWAEPRTLTVEQFLDAWSSTLCPSPPRCACHVFHFPADLRPLEEILPLSLSLTVDQMRRPFAAVNGLKAIRRFCRQVVRWGRIFEGDELRLNLELSAFMLEKAGTGGGNFRNLFYRFLREAAERLDAPELGATADVYRRLARLWREVAAGLDASALDPSRGLTAADGSAQTLLDEIDTLEHRGIDEIEAWLAVRGVDGTR